MNNFELIPAVCKPEVQAALYGGSPEQVQFAFEALLGEIILLRNQVGRVRASGLRAEEAAIARSQDCEAHGADLAAAIAYGDKESRRADSLDGQRVVWVEACLAIQKEFTGDASDLGRWIVKTIETASKKQQRIRSES